MRTSSGFVSGVLIVSLIGIVLALMGPQLMRGLIEYSATDDDMAERCFEPAKGDKEWQLCLTHKENISEPVVPAIDGDFPTGGGQVMADGYGADPEILNNNTMLLNLLNSATECCGSTVLKHVDHAFTPQGATLLGLLSTSHYAVHTVCVANIISLSCVLFSLNVILIIKHSGQNGQPSLWMSTSALQMPCSKFCGLPEYSAKQCKYVASYKKIFVWYIFFFF